MSRRLSNKYYWILTFIILHFFHYLDYVNYNPTIGGQLSNVIVLLLIVYVLTRKIDITNAVSYKYVLYFMLVPMLSIIPCYLDRGQSLFISFRAFMPSGIWLLYFFLQDKKFNADKVVKVILIIAFLRIGITFVEQFTYPVYYFANRTDIELENGIIREVEIRSGFRRYLISDTFFSMFAIFFYYQKLIERHKKKIIWLILFLIACFGLYMDQSRQFLASTVGSIAILSIFSSKYGLGGKIAFIALIVGIYVGYNFLFSELASKTTEELNDDNIRVASYAFYLFDYWGGPLSIIFGNGLPGSTSDYGIEIQKLETTLHFYRSDVGIVGALNIGGICTVLVFFFYYFKVVRKNWSYMELYQQLFLISALLNIPLIFPITQGTHYKCFWAILLFIIDRTIYKKNTIHK